MDRFRYKRILLVLVALILPSIVIALLGWLNATQERELDVKRLKDEERDTIVRIHQRTLDLLEHIKSDESTAAEGSPARRSTAYSNPGVKVVGWDDDGRLILPWEIISNIEQIRQSIEEKDFALKIEEAGRFENVEPVDYPHAESIYRALVLSAEAANNFSQVAYARVRLARTLKKSGSQLQALAVYRELVILPPVVVDEQGIPFTLLGASPLAEMHIADREVVDRLILESESLTALTTTWESSLKGVLEELKKSRDAAVGRDAERALTQLTARDEYLEQIRALQKSFPTLGVTHTDWLPYGKDTWLVGMTAPKAESKPLVIAVRAEDVFKEIESRTDSERRFVITVGGADGEPLGESLPGLRVIFRPVGYAGTRDRLDAPVSPYLRALPFVVVLTLAGGYLLWRDTRRESRMAEMRSQFVSSVSHELKTPLTSIRMFAETLQMNDATPPETRAEYLETIVSETGRLTRLLNNVLDFSQIERGQKNYHMQTTTLAEVVDSVVRTVQFPLSQQGFDLRVNICDGIPPVRADRDAVEQAILNLLSNAMKYSGKSREIELKLCLQGGSALIQVTDRGIGIPAEEQKHVFQRFYRVATFENRAISGTGLGLALVAHIAEAHGGSVEVVSKPGEGSTFSIHLPLNMSHLS